MKQTIKKIIQKLGLLPLADWIIVGISRHSFLSLSSAIKFYIYNYWITYFPSNFIRILYLKKILKVKIGSGSFIHMGCFFDGKNIAIGDNTVIGRNCYLGGSGGNLIIQNNVSITAQTYIFCSTHQKDSPTFSCEYKDVIIESNSWIGARAMILPGVIIGTGAILGAASTATKNIPAFCVYAGTPAKFISKRNKKLTYKLEYFPLLQ